MKKIDIIIVIYGLLDLDAPIKLRKNIQIRTLAQKEEDLLGKSINWSLMGRATCPYWYVVDIKYEYDPKDASEPYPMYLIKYQNIESALRLYYQNDVGFTASIIDGKVNSLYPFASASSSKPFDSKIDFITFWNQFEKAYIHKPLAFDLFSRALIRTANNDQSIMYCTVLESIFVPKGERRKSEFIKQGVTVLGFTATEIQMVSDLYKYRNTIVHGDQNENLKLSVGAKFTLSWFEHCTELIRKILFKYTENPW